MVTSTVLSSEMIQKAVQQYFAASQLPIAAATANTPTKIESMVLCFAEDAISHEAGDGVVLQGHAELRPFFQGMIDLFETIALKAEFTAVNGNEAAVKWTGQGVGKNGRVVTFEGIDVFEVNAAGKIQTMRAYWNPAAMLAALQGVA